MQMTPAEGHGAGDVTSGGSGEHVIAAQQAESTAVFHHNADLQHSPKLASKVSNCQRLLVAA